MNTELSNLAKCFGCYNEQNEIIGFCAVLHRPNKKILNLKGIHRLVILPDYQGIGIGTKFLNIVAEYYAQQGFEISIPAPIAAAMGSSIMDTSLAPA